MNRVFGTEQLCIARLHSVRQKVSTMLDANYLCTQAALCFEITRTLSDRAAAERLRGDAMGTCTLRT